jgi:hypothetical protein
MSATPEPQTPHGGLVRLLDQNLLTLLSLVLVAYLLFGVPQVHTIWWEVPTQISQQGIGWKGVVFILFVVGVALFYPVAWLVLRVEGVRRWLGCVARYSRPSVRNLLKGARLVLGGWWVDLAARLSGRGRILLGLLLVGLAVVVGGACAAFPALRTWLDRQWPLAGMLGPPLAILLFVGGFWLGLVEFLAQRGQPDAPYQGFSGLLGRFLALSFVTALGGEAIWCLAHAAPGIISYRVYTIWGTFHVAFLIIALAAVLDVWHEDWNWPVRQVTFGLLALFALTTWFLKPDPVGRPGAVEAGPRQDWYDVFLSRLEATAPGAPVVLVAASGGGSRAAYFAALVYESLKQKPLRDSSCQQLQVPISPDRKGWRKAVWADQVVLISSVSGGSLATAYHVHDPAAAPWADALDLRNSFGKDLERQATDLSKDLVEPYREALQSAPRYGKAGPYRTNVDAFLKEPLPSLGDEHYSWLVRSRLADAMCTDFMAPLLRGFMTPVGQRGIALGEFWEEKLGWKGCNNLAGYRERGYGSETAWPAPLVLFNATDARLGTRRLLGFPPLLARTFNADPRRAPRPIDFQPDGSEFHTLSLADFDPGYRLSLAEAVRLSANFPWGVHSARLHGPAGDLDLLDGGVNDNTGIASLLDMITHLDALSAAAKPGPAALKAQRIMEELRRRGVVVIEIDSGAKPSVDPVTELRTPAQGLENAGYASAFEARKGRLERLNTLLAPINPIKELQEVGKEYGYVAWQRFQCNHRRYEVMTAWALPPTDKATILATALWEYRAWTRIELETDFPRWLRAWEKQAGQAVQQPLLQWSRDALEEGPPRVWQDKEKARQVLRQEMLKP